MKKEIEIRKVSISIFAPFMKRHTKVLILSIGVLAVIAGTGTFLFLKKIRSAEYAYEQSQTALKNKDGDAMLRWLHVAGTRGDVRAQLMLAAGFETGAFGGVKNEELAAAWYKKAAEAGNGVAQFNLGTFYWLGRGVPADKNEAIALWEKSAKNGTPNAANNLGICYRDGLGAEKDANKAREYFISAATKDFTEAQFNLGLLYETEDNRTRALYWYEKAAVLGNEKARKRFELLTDSHL